MRLIRRPRMLASLPEPKEHSMGKHALEAAQALSEDEFTAAKAKLLGP
jgi:hypothetical protein